jgi:hypothetical protein
MYSRKLTTSIVVGVAGVAVAGGAFGIVNANAGGSSATASAATPSSSSSAAPPAKSGSNARSAPSEGGSYGTVDSVSTASFTLTTAAGQKVTVNLGSSTTYKKGTTSASASAVTAGESVIALGVVNSSTITATQVIVQATDDGGSAASSAAGVVPFQQGAPSTAKSAGQIPADYTEGDGTIVSGTTADKAAEAALAAYPGGTVDRIVQLSDGTYEVHNIGVNWPHHVFVSQDFKVVGAN